MIQRSKHAGVQYAWTQNRFRFVFSQKQIPDQKQNLCAVYGVRLLRFSSLPITYPGFSARGGIHGPKHCKHGSAL